MVLHIPVSEGRQYKVGSLTFTGVSGKIFSTNDFVKGSSIDGKLHDIDQPPRRHLQTRRL